MNKMVRSVSYTGKAGKSVIMPEETTSGPEKSSGSKDRLVLFCEQCYRYDKHIPVKIGPVFKLLAIIFTFGLALIFWPKRCSCCGSIRF
jgi:hypothetical protein